MAKIIAGDNVLQNWRWCHVGIGDTSRCGFNHGDMPHLLLTEEQLNSSCQNSIDYTFAVAKATLTVTADDDATRVYGEDLKFTTQEIIPSLKDSSLGNDAPGIDTLQHLIPTASTSNVDTYVLSVGGGADDNYSFTYVTGTLTITAAANYR